MYLTTSFSYVVRAAFVSVVLGRTVRSVIAAHAYDFPTVRVPSADNFVLNDLTGQPPQTRYYEFVVEQLWGAPDGVVKPMLVVNGMFPGPTIEANQHDRLVVKVINRIANATTIHWHGIPQNGTAYYDGTAGVTECGIPPGESLTYNFTFGAFSGSTWWQSVLRHSLDFQELITDDTQYTDGITGALIVHPTAPNPPGLPTWDEELVVQLTDVYHTFSTVLNEQYLSPQGPVGGEAGDEPVPDSGALNGLGQYHGLGSYFNFNLKPNKSYRLRLIHTGSLADIRFSVDHHPLTVIEADGTLTAPTVVSGVTLAVAQRYSVLLTTNQMGGAYWMRTLQQVDMFTYTLPGQNPDVRGIIRYGTNDETSVPPAMHDPGAQLHGKNLTDLDSYTLPPAVLTEVPDNTKFYRVSFEFDNLPSGASLAYMNGTSWTPPNGTNNLLELQKAYKAGGAFAPEGSSVEFGNQFFVTEDATEVVDLLLENNDDGDHPFHLHGYRPWIVGVGSSTYTPANATLNTVNPLARDTVEIPANGWVVLRFVTDNPGVWTLHCHIAWHMSAGLLMQFVTLPSIAARLDIPQEMVRMCGAA
ncbi:multicopper oxidase [Phanerochaete sordida]|uniref:laccase n=1 Tax=Phanerochaete sordida TaxID=48140 RepID=A0A9P3LI18_9APHY|nr:multicopper oxidase [Phanerochaete sordida]